MPDTYVTVAELEKTRSAAEFAKWVETKHPEIGQTEDGRKAYRNRLGLLKEFVTEALPLAITCELYFNLSEHVYITHLVGNQDHDAVVEDNRKTSSGLQFLEVTMASENFDSTYRMRHLNEHCSVPLTGKVTVARNRKAGTETIDIEPHVAVEHGAFRQGVLDDILAAAKRKGAKNYPRNTGLIIGFNPGPAFQDERDLQSLDDFVVARVLPCVTDFARLFVSGGCGGPFRVYEVR